jgi:uncharacterized protein YdaU (DUF1376 family)
MSTQENTNNKPMPWIKMNFREMIGQYHRLSYEELGVFMHVASAMWAAEGVTMSLADVKNKLRMREGSHESAVVDGLVGYALNMDEQGMLTIDWLSKAFGDVAGRQETARANARKRWDDKDRSKGQSRGTTSGDEDSADF